MVKCLLVLDTFDIQSSFVVYILSYLLISILVMSK